MVRWVLTELGLKSIFKFEGVLVCFCHPTTDRDVDAAIDEGARTVADLGRRCGAGTGCGSCHSMIDMMLADDGSATPIDLARAASRAAHAPSCADCPRRAVAGIQSPSHKKLGEAA